jgi:asparaginyl-tRNA synthetase
MIEPEVAFAGLDDLVGLAEALVVHLVQAALREHRDDLASVGRDTGPLEKIAAPFPRMTYTEAVDRLHDRALHERLRARLAEDRAALDRDMERLRTLERRLADPGRKRGRERMEAESAELREHIREEERDLARREDHLRDVGAFEWGGDLGADEESVLSGLYERPLVITEYPRGAKAFYMKQAPHDPRVVLNLDVLAPEGYGEIIGGSRREDDESVLLERMREEGMDPAPYEWYLDLRRYGSVPHGGFGLGVERTVAWICGLRHIREAIAFPRTLGRIYP